MLFMITFEFEPEHRAAAIERFRATGAPSPKGVKMLGRWHDASMRRGFALAEAKDTAAVASWCHQWADLLSFEVIPVLDDKQFSRVIRS